MTDENATPGTVHKPSDCGATGAYAPLDAASELLRILDQYLADLQGGKAPDRAQVLADHPDLAQQLEQCLAGIEFVHQAAKSPAEMPTQLGEFRIIREVGRGGMGVVYEAEQISLKRRVALKVLRLGIGTDAEVMQRFQREAETVAHLHHTNIVPIHAVGCEQGVHYYAMQFIEGQSFAAVIAEGQKAPAASVGEQFQQVAQWGLQAAEALAHAHQRGVIHRDIKPSNLILDPEGTVWLTDFGLAKRADELTLTAAGVLMGTPRYMSPEQAAATKQPIDHRTDIYSLGATLYELVTGRPVFEAQTPQGVIAQILNAEPVAPRLLQGRLPRDLETIVLKCLAKEPERRYQQARDLADDLRAFLENRTIKARRPRLVERAVRWSKKKRGTGTVAAVAVAASVLLLVAALLGWSLYQQSQLGQVQLSTGGPNLVAEILDDEDRVIVPNLAVPTPQPVSVPAGNYRLRLSGSGLLSETWPLEVPRFGQAEHGVTLASRWLWDPLEIRTGQQYELADLEGRTDLILLSTADRSVRRIGGLKGTALWENDFVFNDKSRPAGIDPDDWHNLGTTLFLVAGSHDLNGDGVRDIVVGGRSSPLLAALSGKDGSLLWHVRGHQELPAGMDAAKWRVQSRGGGNVLGQPCFFDVDGDGVPDVITTFSTSSTIYVNDAGNTFQENGLTWLEAVSGKTGKPLWRYRDLQKNTTIQRGNGPDPRPQVIALDGKPTVVVMPNSALFWVDAKTGQEMRPPLDLKFLPVRPLQIANVDANGQPAALLLRDTQPEKALPILSARSLRTGAILWEKPYDPVFGLGGRSMDGSKQELFVLNEQNRSGGPVIALPYVHATSPLVYDSSLSGNRTRQSSYSGAALIDAVSGQTRWQRRLWFTQWLAPSEILRVTIGPDLDGDGQREVFVAWVGVDHNRRSINDPRFVCVEALSGQDGHTLWRWRQELASTSVKDETSPLHWWQDGADGWPQLLVPVQTGRGGQPMTYVLSSATGRLTHTLPEVTEFQVADCNGDGIGDLIYRVAPQGASRLVVLPGRPAPAWQVLEEVHVAEDFDGDQTTDVFTRNHQQALSGHDGRKLWPKPVSSSGWSGTTLVLPLSAGESSGRGAAVVKLEGGFGPFVTAYSGTDLRRVWDSQRQAYGSFPNVGWCRTKEEGPADLVFVTRDVSGNWPSDRPPQFGVVSGLDGSTRWETDVADGGSTLWKGGVALGGFDLDARYGRFDVDDLNGDGVRDFVMWVPGKAADGQSVSVLQALSGETGQPLWEKTPLQLPARPPPGAFVWPRPVCFDWDGDGQPDVLVAMHGSRDQAHGRTIFQLIVLDGRTGAQKDSRHWLSSEFDAQMPLVIDFDGTGRKSLCVACLDSNNEGCIVMLRGGDQPAPRIPLQHGHQDTVAGGWSCVDLDGDGKADIVYVNDGRLQARHGGDLKELWSWTLDGQPTKLLHLEPASPDHPATVVVWRGRTIYGLGGRDATVRWRCEADSPPPPPPGYNEEPAWGLLRTGDPSFVPRFLYPYDKAGTICTQARPTTAAGVYVRAEPMPLESFPAVDQAWYRTLPWTGDWHLSPLTFVPDGLFVLWLVYLGRRRRWWQLGFWAGACFALTALWAAKFLSAERAMLPEERYSWEGWYGIFWYSAGVSTLVMFLWVAFSRAIRLVRRLIRGTSV